VLGLLAGPTVATAGAAQPQASAAPAGTWDGRSRLTVEMPGDEETPGSVTVTVGGAPQAARVVPLLSDRTATVVVVDASDAGGPQLQPGLSGSASLVLSAPPAARSALVADRDPPAVVAPLAVGSSDTLRGLTTVRPGGARRTAAALDLALQQFPPGPDDPRVIVLYTAAPDAGGPSAADLGARLTEAGAVLAVVVPAPDVPTYWAATAAATGGTAVATRSGVMAAFDALAAALRTRCLVTFPVPPVLPFAAVVHADTPQGRVTADAVVSPPVAAVGSTGARGPSWVGGAVGGLVLLAALLLWVAVRSARRRSGTVLDVPDGGVWNVPPRDEHAAPRDRLLAAMHAAVRDGRPAVLRPARGAAGQGTTTAMIEFAHRWRDDHDITWWVLAADPPLVADRLAELAEILGLAAPTDTAEEATERLLAALQRRGRWLLVFDDAASPRQLARFLPGGSGHVLVASDDPEWDRRGTPVPVGPSDRADSVAVLRSRRPSLTAAEADRVAAALDDMPEAVDVAGATLAESRMSVASYLRELTEHATAGGSAGATACTVALDLLAADDPHAWDLMATLAWLGPGPVPLSLLAVPSGLGDSARQADLTAVLQRRGLARVDAETVELYPSPARVIVRQSEDGGRAAAGVRLLRAAAPAAPDSPAWRMWLPHVLAVTDPARRLDDVVLDVGWLLSSAGSYLRARGEARAARALFEDAHELYRRRLGPDHPDTIAAARALADDLEALGRQEHARRLRQDAGVGGPRDPEAG
jgi:hypothetical protein